MNEHPTTTNQPYGNPAAMRLADVVMKGGITSGVIYPLAVCELSRAYLFKSIGGTSAGAIAASLTAAAEYRRRRDGSTAGFDALAALPEQLGQDKFILHLFRPDARTRGLFGLVTGLLGAKGWLSKVLIILGRGLCVRPWAVLGSIPGLVIVWFAVMNRTDTVWSILAGLAGLLLVLFGVLAALVLGLIKELVSVDRNFFGLCSGIAEAEGAGPPGLTRWLTSNINEIAGNPAQDPLTFGDLWGAPMPEALRDQLAGDKRSIDLRTITTCLTQGRPYSIPWDTEQFYFCKEEWSRLFPATVVDAMLRNSRESDTAKKPDGTPLYLFPKAEHLPVIVAARMSLSFPFLISAVPLWSKQFRGSKRQVGESLQDAPEAGAETNSTPGVPYQCWFSDGGITSNFPLHFYDSIIPRWPTFGLNLRYFPKHETVPPTDCDGPRVVMSERNSDGSAESVSHLPAQAGAARVGGFFGLIQSSMQSWSDNSYLRLPGYRDRIASIWLKPDEGGMNLEMKRETVLQLAAWGKEAGEKLRERFANPHHPEDNPMSWDNHRIRRAHGGLAALHEVLESIENALNSEMPGDSSVRRVLDPEGAKSLGLGWSRRLNSATPQALNQIAELARRLEIAGPFKEPPRPTVNLRSRAPL